MLARRSSMRILIASNLLYNDHIIRTVQNKLHEISLRPPLPHMRSSQFVKNVSRESPDRVRVEKRESTWARNLYLCFAHIDSSLMCNDEQCRYGDRPQPECTRMRSGCDDLRVDHTSRDTASPAASSSRLQPQPDVKRRRQAPVVGRRQR